MLFRSRQFEVIEASGAEELCDVRLTLKHLGRSPGRRLMLSGGGGGLGTYAADLAEKEGLEVPPLRGDTLARLQKLLSQPGASVGNPMDIAAPLIHLPIFEMVMHEAATNPATDILIFDMALNFAHNIAGEKGLDEATEILLRIKAETGRHIVMVMYSRAIGEEDMVFEEKIGRAHV